MIELYAQPKKNIFESTTTSTKTNTEFLYFYNNDKTDKEATYLEYNAIRLYKKGKIYLNDIFGETGEYEITFKIHYVNNTSTGGLYIRAVDVDGSNYTYAPLFENYFLPGNFPTDGSYTKKITNAGNNKDLLFAIDGDDDVYIYDINITTTSGILNTHTISIFNTTTTPYYWLQLGVDEKANMVLSKSLKDIREPDKIKSSYSQTFLLPATEINQKFFGYLNHNDSDPDFNVLTLQKCFLVVNGIDIGLGNLELKNIITTDTGSKYFNVLYKSDAIDIFTILTDKLLMNLETDFSIDTSISNIESLVSAYDNGKELVEANQDYSFGIMNRGKQMEKGDYMNTFSYNSQEIANTKGLLGKDMIPVIPAKTILINMFTNEGYTIDGSLFDDDIFKSLVVPLYSPIITNELSEYDEQEIITPEFTHCLATVNSLVGRNIDGDFAVLGESYNVAHADEYQNFNYGRRPTLLYNSISILNTQPMGWWTLSPRKDQRTNIRITGEINVFGGALVSGSDFFYDEYELDLYIVYPTTDGLHASDQKVKTWNNKLKWDNDEYEEDYLVIGDNTTTIDFLLPAVYLYKDETFSNDAAPFLKFKIKKIDTIGGSTGQEIQFRWDFNLKLESEVENIEFVYPDILQEPMKYLGDSDTSQMDFVKSLSNMFNLYISVDKNNKIINFDLHNGYYSDDSYDLTEKIILDKKIDKKFLSSITPRINNFMFKEYNTQDKDKYFNDFDERPGDLEYISDNEISTITSNYNNSSIFVFSRETQIINNEGKPSGVSFNMAEILRYDDEDNPISKNEYNIPFNFMFLNKATTASNMTLRDIELNTESIKPMIISNRNDFDNKFHLTYKTPKRVYTDINYNYDNLFTNYWKDYIGSFSDKNSYMLIAEFWLDALDFVKLKINTLVRIQNELYFINKIKNWSPMKPTKMELYKLNKRNIGNNEPDDVIPIDVIPSNGSDSISINFDVIGDRNIIFAMTDSSVNGDNNNVSNSSDLVVRNDNNQINNTTDSLISGNNNIVNNSTNITMTGCEGVTLTNCSNLIITDEVGTSYINNINISTGQQMNVINTGGVNVIQEPFTDAGIIDSGEDEIYKDNWIDSMKKQDGNQ